MDVEGLTPVHFAAQRGQIRVLEWLYLHGALITCRDCYGFTPLHWAAHNNHVLVAQHLLVRGVGWESEDALGRTAMSVAALRGHAAWLDSVSRVKPHIAHLSAPYPLTRFHFLSVKTWRQVRNRLVETEDLPTPRQSQ
eukprot:1959657-Amphidinium_carterae.1